MTFFPLEQTRLPSAGPPRITRQVIFFPGWDIASPLLPLTSFRRPHLHNDSWTDPRNVHGLRAPA